MPYFKLPNDPRPHFIDAGVDPSDYFPIGFVQINDEEAQIMRIASIPAPTVDSVRTDRDARINAVSWKYERHAREVRLGLPLTDDIAALDRYVQNLADVPNQIGFPNNINWPALP